MKRSSFDKTDRILTLILKWGSVACLIGLLLLISAGILVRFVPIASLGWADEIIEMGFAYMVFLGAAMLWKEKSHFRVDMVPTWLKGSRPGQVLEIIVSLFCLFFFLVFAYEGWILTGRTVDNSPILDLPKFLWYAIMPITGSIMVGHTILDIRRLFRS